MKRTTDHIYIYIYIIGHSPMLVVKKTEKCNCTFIYDNNSNGRRYSNGTFPIF